MWPGPQPIATSMDFYSRKVLTHDKNRINQRVFVSCLSPRGGCWKWSKSPCNMIHLMPCRLYIILAIHLLHLSHQWEWVKWDPYFHLLIKTASGSKSFRQPWNPRSTWQRTSQVAMRLLCPRKFFNKFFLNKKINPSLMFCIGSSVKCYTPTSSKVHIVLSD